MELHAINYNSINKKYDPGITLKYDPGITLKYDPIVYYPRI